MDIKAVTSRFLARLGACEDQLDLFKKVFPRGARLSEASVIKAVEARLDLGWLAAKTLSGLARAEYRKVCALAWSEYEKACGPALAEYEKVCDLAWSECEKAHALAKAEYEKACGPALAEYDKIYTLAWTNYEKACGLAWLKLLKIEVAK